MQPYYNHHTSQPVLSLNPSQELQNLVAAKFYYLHNFLMTTSTIRLGRKCHSFPQLCYLRCLHTVNEYRLQFKDTGYVQEQYECYTKLDVDLIVMNVLLHKLYFFTVSTISCQHQTVSIIWQWIGLAQKM